MCAGFAQSAWMGRKQIGFGDVGSQDEGVVAQDVQIYLLERYAE